MNLLDLLILLVLAIQTASWSHAGFARRFMSLVGFWIGFILGVVIAPLALSLSGDPVLKLLLALMVIFALSTIFGLLGHAVGHKLRKIIDQIKLGKADAIIGAAFSLAAGLLMVWFFAAIISGTPFRGINRLVRDSAIVRGVNEVMPSPPDAFSRIAGLINPERFPQIFLGPEPQPIAPVKPPSSAEVASALEAAGDSVVRFESLGCGGVVFGTGFVVAPNLVATNAHVVAGVDRLILEDLKGTKEGQVVYFDSMLDFALIKTRNLAGPPLDVDGANYKRGTTATVLGYPGGGPLEADAAGILRQLLARGLDIYNDRVVDREIYMLQTDIEPGNSGGPLVTSDGTVIGMIFGRSEADENIAYAISGSEITDAMNRAGTSSPVASGVCVN